jgi:prophage regulatory protein
MLLHQQGFHSMETETLLNIRQVAKYLGVASGTLYHWLSEHKGPPPIRLSSRCVRWRPSDVEAWLAERVVVDFRSRSGKKGVEVRGK